MSGRKCHFYIVFVNSDLNAHDSPEKVLAMRLYVYWATIKYTALILRRYPIIIYIY